MKIVKTPIPGLIILEPAWFNDQRGYFFETWQKSRYIEAGIDIPFVQDNESCSVKGVVRGLHYQLSPYGQAKLVRVVVGKVFDVAVDLRVGSPTFGKWYGVELDSERKRQFFIPAGFAHGFSVLSDRAIFTYKCSNYYNVDAERSINPLDLHLNIDWQLGNIEPVISTKDGNAPSFSDAEINFSYDDTINGL